MRRVVAALVAGLLIAASGLAEEPWKKKPPAEWSQKEALKALSDSPWAKEVSLWQVTGQVQTEAMATRRTVYQDAPGEPATVIPSEVASVAPRVAEARYRVAWSSARLLREAWERLEQLAPQALTELHAPPPELPPDHLVLTARVVNPPEPPALPLFAGLSDDDLRARAQLMTSEKRLLRPVRVLRHGLGAGAAFSFLFPRSENGRATLGPGAKWVEFVFEGPQGDKLKARFKPGEMRARGQPDY